MPKKLLFLSFELWILSFFVSPAYAAGISLSPSFQEINILNASASAGSSATVEFSNQTESSANLEFSLAKIMATDLLGRLQFNAPLPQTITLDPNLVILKPDKITLNPGETATISATFNPAMLKPGTNAFLLLGHIQSSDLAIQRSNASVNQYLASTILVNAPGGSTILVKLIKSDLSFIPLRFSLPDFITLTLKNEGNARAIPRGLAMVKDQFGRELMRGPINEKSSVVLPGSQRVIYANLQPIHRPWPLAWITTQLVGYDDQHQSSFKEVRHFLYLSPWMLLAIPAIFIIIIIKRRIPSPTPS